MSKGERSWPLTETGGDGRHARDLPDRRPGESRQLGTSTPGQRTASAQPNRTPPTDVMCATETVTPVSACTVTAGDVPNQLIFSFRRTFMIFRDSMMPARSEL